MRLKLFSIAYPAATISLLGVIAIALWLVATSFTHVNKALEQRKVTLALTSELTHLTEQMSRLVRAYAATGDTRYLTEYYALTGYRTVMGGSGLREYLKSLTADVERLADMADARTNTAVEQATSRLWQAIVIACTAMSVLLILTLLGSVFIGRLVLKPIRRLADAADTIAQGNYSTRVRMAARSPSSRPSPSRSTTWPARSKRTSRSARKSPTSSRKRAPPPSPRLARSRCSSPT